VTAEQRLLHANGHLQKHLMRARARRGAEHARVAHRTAYRACPVPHRTARWAYKTELQRSNPNGLLTWLVHRTVSGGAPDCPVRHATAAFQRPLCGGWGYKYPNHPTFKSSKFSTFQLLTRALAFNSRHTKVIKSSLIPYKALVISERDLLCSLELLRLDCFLLFLIFSCDHLNCNQGKRHQLCGGPCGEVWFPVD
jgi:hypothetical protein